MAEALGLDGVAPLLVERTPNEELLPLEEPDPEAPPEPPSGSVH
jgi:hypothetical protein